jgi:subtilase family serine protease
VHSFHTRLVPVLAVAAGAVIALTAAGTGQAASGPAPAPAPAPATGSFAGTGTPVDACSAPQPGHVSCFAQYRAGARHKSTAVNLPDGTTALPDGYGPADLQSAYNLASAIKAGDGTGETVAVVDAYDDPTAEADLAVYRSTYGLPPCTTDNGCFSKVNEQGQASPLPSTDDGWSIEISLDLDAVSAACPNCHITLVESDSSGLPDMAASENTAVAVGANVVSNSYGGTEGSDLLGYAADYDHPGVAITASSGDGGYSLIPNFPADLTTVTAVGGTTLSRADNARGWTETAWAANVHENGAGAGCSAYIAKPAWQHDTACPGRTISDVSADADPYTGLAVYDSTPNPDNIPTGWAVVGGTSAASPLVAGVYGLAGHTSNVDNAAGLYAHPRDFNDAVGGDSAVIGIGNDCPATSYLCSGVRGYDGPTGLGTPDGIAGF